MAGVDRTEPEAGRRCSAEGVVYPLPPPSRGAMGGVEGAGGCGGGRVGGGSPVGLGRDGGIGHIWSGRGRSSRMMTDGDTHTLFARLGNGHTRHNLSNFIVF